MIFEDLPDISLDDLLIKRLKVTDNENTNTIHAVLNNGYTIALICNYKYEGDYNEMEEIIYSIRVIND